MCSSDLTQAPDVPGGGNAAANAAPSVTLSRERTRFTLEVRGLRPGSVIALPLRSPPSEILTSNPGWQAARLADLPGFEVLRALAAPAARAVANTLVLQVADGVEEGTLGFTAAGRPSPQRCLVGDAVVELTLPGPRPPGKGADPTT